MARSTSPPGRPPTLSESRATGGRDRCRVPGLQAQSAARVRTVPRPLWVAALPGLRAPSQMLILRFAECVRSSAVAGRDERAEIGNNTADNAIATSSDSGVFAPCPNLLAFHLGPQIATRDASLKFRVGEFPQFVERSPCAEERGWI
jgi:hypothetical protein